MSSSSSSGWLVFKQPTRLSVILVNRSSRSRATLFSRLRLSSPSSRFANGSRSSSSAMIKEFAIFDVIIARLLCSLPLSLSARLAFEVLMSPKTSEKSSPSSSAYFWISISDWVRCSFRVEVELPDRCRILPLLFISRIDFGPALRSLGWKRRGEKESEGELECVTTICLGNIACGCVYCIAASLRSKAPSSAGVRSE
jgi:hypothetical protein